jgi:hypothetical protein
METVSSFHSRLGLQRSLLPSRNQNDFANILIYSMSCQSHAPLFDFYISLYSYEFNYGQHNYSQHTDVRMAVCIQRSDRFARFVSVFTLQEVWRFPATSKAHRLPRLYYPPALSSIANIYARIPTT